MSLNNWREEEKRRTGLFATIAPEGEHIIAGELERKCLQVDCNSGSQAGMIIALVNSKGGVGKSTIAGNLAGWLHAQQHSVILVDCDTQCSSSEWINEAAPEIQVVRLASADEVLDELPALAKEADYVVCDGPGSQTETSRALLMWADLAIIPCKASMFEARALDKNTSFVRQAQAIRKGPPRAIAVLSMVGKDYRLTKDMREAAIGLNLSLASTAITLRQAYADCPGQGKLPWQLKYNAREAAREIDSLFREVFPEAANTALDEFSDTIFISNAKEEQEYGRKEKTDRRISHASTRSR